jgi:hypothetical protein
MAAPKSAKAAKTQSARVVPKVSPKRGMSVSAWVAEETDGWKATVVKRVLAIAAKAVPGATHAIKWSQPVIEQGGPIAFIKPATAHVTFGFWRGAELTDPDGRLEGGDRMKHIKLRSADDVDEKQFTAWLKEAAKLNATKGDPSRRG